MSANDDSYTYDSRGNITSKTVGDTVTNFTYANTGWKDLLVSVDDIELEYDANGNVILYGDREFTWTYGRSLASVLDGMDEYTYTYDENGIRTSKTVDDVTTYYNTKDGVILSQTDGTDTIYFQYDNNGAPLGFVWNGTQYLYLTNQMGDVISITDTSGTVVANYEYDAWGKVLTADTNIAKQNPIRYRGYYYDNETCYYYLQSRYYDSNICRFINSDNTKVAQSCKDYIYGKNSFAYCSNNPINETDNNGNVFFSIIVKSLSKMLLGVLSQYAGDIISNIISGRRGKNAFKPSSSFGDYLSAALTALIPGNKIVSMISRATVSTAISTFEYTIKKYKTLPLKTIIKRMLVNYLCDLCCTVISSAFSNRLRNLSNKKYSKIQHSSFFTGEMTLKKLEKDMKRTAKRMLISTGAFEFFTNSIFSALSRKF